ncbi:MAG: phage scaffolding protein [Firmicutes bacterium]|nr:phage scaffolding protein [Bacillota bacterium]
MNKKFLTDLGISEESANKILYQQKKETDKIKFENIVSKKIAEAGAKDEKVVRALLDLGGLELADGDIEGLEERIELLKEDCAYLFEEKTQLPIFSNVNTGSDTDIKRENFKKMGYAKRLKLFCENPELYKKLV